MRFPLSAREPRIGLRRAPSPALVLAVIAVAGGGVSQAWAAGLLTGDDIANGSLTGKDVKDGSIGPSDISRTGRAALAGKVGPTGPAGPTGVAGATGPAGPGGARGPQGAEGAKGEQGPTGATGPTGSTGVQGVAGQDSLTLWAVVDGSPSDAPSIIATSATQAATVTSIPLGNDVLYKVAFPRDVSACAAIVTRRLDPAAGSGGEPITRSMADAEAGGSAYSFVDPSDDPNVLTVRLLQVDGTPTKGSFSVALRCPDVQTP